MYQNKEQSCKPKDRERKSRRINQPISVNEIGIAISKANTSLNSKQNSCYIQSRSNQKANKWRKKENYMGSEERSEVGGRRFLLADIYWEANDQKLKRKDGDATNQLINAIAVALSNLAQ